MEDLDKEEYQKNIYIIRRKLSTYRMLPGERDWIFNIGDFQLVVRLTTDDYWKITNHGNNLKALETARIIDLDKVNVDLYEGSKRDPSLRNYVYINRDPRFKNHIPIQYDVIQTPTGGRITHNSDGKDMPILHLCELIKHLYRLSNLAVFA